MGNETLKKIATKLTETIKNSTTILKMLKKNTTSINEEDIINYLINVIKENIRLLFSKIFNSKSPSISISLNVNSHKKSSKVIYKNLDNLSYGQKSVTMLTIILEGFTK